MRAGETVIIQIAPDLEIEIDPDDTGVSRSLRNNHGIFEANTNQWMMASLRSGSTFVDVGANLGYFTLFGSRRVGPRGRVIAFEPMDNAFSYLRRNVERNALENVTLEKVAVSDRVGELPMAAHPTNMGDSWLDVNGGLGPVVSTTSIDAYVGDACVDCVKVDIQGFEGLVMHGLARQIASNLDLIIVLEYWPEGLKRANWEASQLLNLIDSHRFQKWDLGGSRAPAQSKLVPFDPNRVQRFTNILLTRRRLPVLR